MEKGNQKGERKREQRQTGKAHEGYVSWGERICCKSGDGEWKSLKTTKDLNLT